MNKFKVPYLKNSMVSIMWSSLIWAILILVIFFNIKAELRDFLKALGGMAKIKFKDLSIELGGAQTQVTFQSQTGDNAQFQMSKSFQSLVVTNEEKTIINQLVDAGLTVDKAIELLIYHLANKNVMNAMLLLDRVIFDEQIRLLVFLNTQPLPVHEEVFFEFYKEWSDKTGITTYTFKNFLVFLIEQGLIINGEHGYSISLIGKEYLSFLIQTGSSRLQTK